MVNFFSILALGFFLGMRHATDPDHVIAVTTIVNRQRDIRKSALIGAFWGVGHTVTIFLVGGAIILFGLVIPPRVGLSMELSVAFMLILLGYMNLRSFLRSMPTVEDAHDHAHVHSHTGERALAHADRLLRKTSIYQVLRPLIVGIVHGLAGSAAVALLVLATIRNAQWAVAYLLVFGLGTIAGMMLITMSIASTFRLVGSSPKFFRRLAIATGLLSLGFGLFVAWQILAAGGLLTAHPQWTPH
ncbi:MAG: high-affinity nickel-transport family protein [Candidatus Angelobacter sp. Gp1-AA117]|nr:MAG: high-affinity nickel-transport family protein [Candidatus Angelobacter sp. Gp1-AA117]